MARFNLELLGDDVLVARLRTLPEKLERKVIRQAMRKAGRPILETARATAPVHTGALKRSLTLRALSRRRGRIGVRIQTGTRAALGIPASARWYYPAIVELGDGTERHPPTRFLRTALDRHRQSSLQVLREEIGRGIEREATSAG